jgi:hypothetical protein
MEELLEAVACREALAMLEPHQEHWRSRYGSSWPDYLGDQGTISGVCLSEVCS